MTLPQLRPWTDTDELPDTIRVVPMEHPRMTPITLIRCAGGYASPTGLAYHPYRTLFEVYYHLVGTSATLRCGAYIEPCKD